MSVMAMLRQLATVEYDPPTCELLRSDRPSIAGEGTPIGERLFHPLLCWPLSSKRKRESWGSRSGRMLLQSNYVTGVNATRIAATYLDGFLRSGGWP
jgi:hypothetical protein